MAVTPLAIAARGQSLGARLWLGWCAGSVATLLTPWLPGAVGFARYFELAPLWGAVAALGVAQLFGAASLALALGATGRGRGPGTFVLRFGLAWGAAEWLRGVAFTGLPWMLLAHGVAPVPEFAAPARFVGALGLSSLLALTGASLAVVLGPSRRDRVVGASALAIIAGVFLATLPPVVGDAAPASGARPAEGALRLALVQEGRPAVRRPHPREVGVALQANAALARQAQGADLVIWAENAVPASWPENGSAVVEVARRLAAEGVGKQGLLLGMPRGTAAGRRNSVVLIGPGGEARGVYDKRRLLPFGERRPWPFPPSRGDLAAGSEARVLDVAEVRLGPLVCYEVLFSDLARDQVVAGATVLVNLSNEAWFGSAAAMEQNLAAAVLRAIETGRPVVRATRTGVTAAVDSTGRVVARSPVDAPALLLVDVLPRAEVTPYVAGGHVFGGVAALLTGVAALVGHARPREPRA